VNRSSLLTSVAFLLAGTAVAAQIQFLSNVYTIDRKYRSMEGPASMQKVYLGDQSKAELLWITGIRTEMVAEDGVTPQLPELMCHVNVDLDTARHQALFNLARPTAARLMTLSQGMLSAKLPPGFGFPMASNEPLLLFTQVLNHNIEHPNNLKVRHRVTFDYVRDGELKEPMKPLFNIGASGMVQLDNNPLALTSMMPTSADASTEAEHHGASCLIGARAPNATATSADYVDPTGRHMTGHWVVPPGRQVNASDITWFMNLPYDTKLHYAAVHLHPFAESLTIRDVTTGAVVLKSHAVNPKKNVGLMHVDTVSSTSGVSFYKDHRYELISVYDNNSGVNADSMASVFLGFDDPEFVRPSAAELAQRVLALLDSDIIAVHTTAGNITAVLARDAAPITIIQFGRLLLGGVFNNTVAMHTESDIRVGVPVTEAIHKLLIPAGGDRGLPPERGIISYCMPTANSNDVQLRISLNSRPRTDGRCVGFARLAAGADVIQSMSEAPVGVNAFITRIDAMRKNTTSTAGRMTAASR
jgi:cyclophilin family peptidyl-prolyl cis-trans isomerase